MQAERDDARGPEVLIVGAGPTGLVLALRLARQGIRVRIIDVATEPGTTSRALGVHARTLEFYRQMGIADGLIALGLPFARVNLWVRGRRVAQLELGDIGRGISPFPFVLIVPQDLHERFLIEHLRRAGVEVERGTELLDFEAGPDGVRARLRRAGGAEESCTASYLAGCDGARSRTREVLGSGFPGGTYSHVFLVADIEGSGPGMDQELHVALDESDLLVIFPLRGGRTGRLVGTARPIGEGTGPPPTWDEVAPRVAGRLGIAVERVNWFSTYAVHHRVAERFRGGRVFLLGDAAHIHSPVGAQGMNTGIGDAVNLAWKLADVLRGRAGAALLDSYETERIAFARRLVSTTDRAFLVATSPGRLARFIRTRIVPLALPPLVRSAAVRRFLFRRLSQTSIHYRDAERRVGGISPGDRLPWIPPAADGSDNHATLDGLRWRVQVYGRAVPELADVCRQLELPLDLLPWDGAARRAGFAEGVLLLLRPDGHIAFVDPSGDAEALARALARSRGGAGGRVEPRGRAAPTTRGEPRGGLED